MRQASIDLCNEMMMFSRLIVFGIVLAAVTSSGCVGWGPGGNEQFRGPFRGVLEGICSTCGDDCCNCDGYNPPYGSVRKRLACGSGCGEIYYGEWLSNPPDTCNDCDARGFAYGINSRFPLLCNWGWWWRPLGYQYGAQGGYGNPLRGAVHPGWAGYGYRNWPWFGQGGMVGCGGCDTGCSGCQSGDCAPNAPGGPNLKPIPNQSATRKSQTRGTTQAKRGTTQPKTGAMKVNYESPLIRESQMTIARNRSATTSSDQNRGMYTNSTAAYTSDQGGIGNSAKIRTGATDQSESSGYGRLRRPNSLR